MLFLEIVAWSGLLSGLAIAFFVARTAWRLWRWSRKGNHGG